MNDLILYIDIGGAVMLVAALGLLFDDWRKGGE